MDDSDARSQADPQPGTRRGERATAVVVAGMHRSGTSALVRVLNLHGVDLPAALYPPRPDNPLGYWEPLHVVEAHEEFLAAVGSSFDDVFALGEGALQGSAARALEDRLVEILQTELGASTQFVVKDPRICRLVPIWINALARFGADPRFVLPIRNPLEVAASLKLRNNYTPTKSLLLWLRHVLDAERNTRGYLRSVVSYENLLRDWHGVADKVARELGLVLPPPSHAEEAELEQYLSPRGRHHAFSADDLDARPDVVDWVKTTYGILSLAADGEALEQDVLDGVRGELDRADRAFGPLLAEERLVQRSQATELTKKTDALADARATLERLRGELAKRQEALAKATRRAAAAEQELEQQKLALKELQGERDSLTKTAADLRKKLADSERAETAARKDYGLTLGQLQEAQAALEGANREIARLTTELAARRFYVRLPKLSGSPSASSARPWTKRQSLSQIASWLAHPHRDGWRLLGEYARTRKAGTFDAAGYLAANPDVGEAGLNPLMHYLEHGIREGRGIELDPTDTGVRAAASQAALLRSDVPTGQTRPVTPVVREVAAETPRPSAPPPPADFSDFIVLLSRQRSGTNALRSILESHPDVFCFNEVLNLPDRYSDDPLLRESNFFTFLQRYGRDDIGRSFADNHERLFLDYLEYLRCLSDKRYAVIDVKYNTMHLITEPYQEIDAPYLLKLFRKHGLYVLNVTRRNYLRYVLSNTKARRSRRFTVAEGEPAYVDAKPHLDPDFVLRELTRCHLEDEIVRSALTNHDRVLTYDYAQMFPGGDVTISPDFLARFAEWRGVDNEFTAEPYFKKQSSLPLKETIENFDAVAAALRGGPFEYCLEDEPAYRSAQPASPAGIASSDTAGENWQEVIGSDPDSFVEALYSSKPSWIEGSLSEDDARFLFRQALESDADEAVEIGTASGFSTSILAHAFSFRAAAGRASQDWRVRSYDVNEEVYFDEARRVGDAARELLPEPLLARVQFNAPATATDVAEGHAADSIRLVFLDADHGHPWPALDILAILDALQPGASILVHDINLPRIHPEFPQWGATHLFESLDVEKRLPDVDVPNIGVLVVPADKDRLRDELLTLVNAHEWEADVPGDLFERIIPGNTRASD